MFKSLATRAGALVLLGAGAAWGQPLPTLSGVSQTWVTRGTTTELTLTGADLGQAKRVILDGQPGLTAELVAGEAGNAKAAKVKLVIDATAAMGKRELRVVTAGGVSNKVDVNVTFLPVVAEAEPNNAVPSAWSLAATQAVTLPATLHGVINGGADIDAFRFTAKKGDRLVFEVFAQRAGSGLDSSLRLHDAAGRELARSEDAIGTDSLLTHEAAADGEYVLIIHDVQYRGGGNYQYRINGGTIAYAQSIFPLGGKRGTTVDAKLTGWNLPASTMRVDLTNKPAGTTTIFATPDGAANPLTFAVSDSDEFIEAEPNQDVAKANVLAAMPVVVNGVIEAAGDVDVFRFKVEKPVKLRFAIDAARFGSSLDALITLHDAKGGVIGRMDDAAPGSDAAIERDFSPGEYHVSITDLTNLGGPGYGYRLSIAPPKPVSPDYSIRFFPDTIQLHRGGRSLVQCEVIRTAGFNGPVTVALKNPPRGVTAKPITIDNGPASGLFIIEAAADADLTFASLSLIATGTQGDVKVERTAQALMRIEPVQAAYVTVLEPLPFTINQAKPLTDEEAKVITDKLAALEAAPQPDAKEIAALRKQLGARDEAVQLKKKLATMTPELVAAQAQWEASAMSDTWTTLEFTEMKSTGGARFTRQKDGAILLSAANNPTDSYTLTASTDLKKITAIRLEALADKSLPAGGPGRAENGNFVLTQFLLSAAPQSDVSKQTKVNLHSPVATFEQQGWPIVNTLDGNDGTGWAVSPNFNQNHTAMFLVKDFAGHEGGSVFTFTLHCLSPHVQHTLGKFRISATTNDKPDLKTKSLPANIAKLLAVPADKRNAKQKGDLAEYFRATTPLLEADRERLAALEAAGNGGDPVMKYNQTSTIAFEIDRVSGFTGDITITALGYAAGRDPQGNPNLIAKDLEVNPVVLKGDQSMGVLTLKAKDKSEMGTRTIVLQAQATINGQKVSQISQTIPVTIAK